MGTQTAVQEKYGSIARSVAESGATACCDPAMRCCDPITKDLYGDAQKGELPAAAVLASLGCGNPTALIDLRPGETVSTSARAAASMCCFPPGASARPARPTA